MPCVCRRYGGCIFFRMPVEIMLTYSPAVSHFTGPFNSQYLCSVICPHFHSSNYAINTQIAFATAGLTTTKLALCRAKRLFKDERSLVYV